MNDVMMRFAEASDAEAISQLLLASARRFFSDEFSSEGMTTFNADFSVERVQERVLSKQFSFRVAVHEGKIIGVCAIRDESHLYSLFIDESFQRHGIATKLWRIAEADMRARGVRNVTVNASSNALDAYKRLGFSITSEKQCVKGVIFTPMHKIL